VRSRFVELGEEFDAFAAELSHIYGGDFDLELDRYKLELAVVSYFNDISRYKSWHFPEEPEGARLDGTKKAAYMAFWLNKAAPISVRRNGRPPPPPQDGRTIGVDPLILITQYFSLHVACNYLGFLPDDELAGKLIYHMLYREESAKHYLLVFEMLDAAHRAAPEKITFKLR
jgi:hypothetical protein